MSPSDAAGGPPQDLQRNLEVVIVGAGFGGLCMAIQLLARGVREFVVLEKGAEVGGTWRDNSYPGAECDVQSHLYSFSFAPKADWSQRYAGWREIQQYILDTTERHSLRQYIRCHQQVTGLHFDAAQAPLARDDGVGTRVRGAPRRAGDRPPARAAAAEAAGSRAFPRTRLSFRAVGPRLRPRRASAWHRSAPAAAPSSIARGSRPTSPACTCSSAPRPG